MTQETLDEIVDGILVESQWSTPTFDEEIAVPLIGSLFSGLKAAELSAIDHPRHPPTFAPGRISARMELGVSAAVIGLVIFVGTSVGSWVVRKLCDGLWDSHIRPALSRFRENTPTVQAKPHPFWFEFSVYYVRDDFLVTVRALIANPQDMAVAEQLIPDAQRSALAWVESRGIDCRELVYTIRDGMLSSIPQKRT